MKAWRSALLILVAGGGACSTVADPQPRRFSAPRCNSCQLQMPPADAPTLKALEDFYRSYNAGKGNVRIAPGDTVMMCNGKGCVDYLRTHDGQWLGENPRMQQEHF